ncbi:hypothetical protein PG994_002612 [Apiospora phragmitis]|uniref:Uncharacterized protein n=1 Tax=Apiospora phragmitis TaxID=2905665 RepID=A0ABR1W5M2_9PEZI
MKDIIKAYLIEYTVYLLGWKEALIRRRFTDGYTLTNDLPPVLWACCENRPDMLQLLHTKAEYIDRKPWAPMDINLATNGRNQISLDVGIHSEWHQRPPPFLDAWECAMRPLDSHGRRKHLNNMNMVNEETCIWLIEHGLGYSTRPGGIPIQHLEEAAVLKKMRVVEALIAHFKRNKTVKKWQRAITLALQAATRGWVGSHKPKPARRYQQRLNTGMAPFDGHEAIIDTLLEAGKDRATNRWQNPDRRDERACLRRPYAQPPITPSTYSSGRWTWASSTAVICALLFAPLSSSVDKATRSDSSSSGPSSPSFRPGLRDRTPRPRQRLLSLGDRGLEGLPYRQDERLLQNRLLHDGALCREMAWSGTRWRGDGPENGIGRGPAGRYQTTERYSHCSHHRYDRHHCHDLFRNSILSSDSAKPVQSTDCQISFSN